MRKNTYFPKLLTLRWGARCCTGNSLGGKCCREYHKIPWSMRCKIDNKKICAKKKKKIHTSQYLGGSKNLSTSIELQEFHYSQGKIQDVAAHFSISKQHTTTLITKPQFLSLCTGFTNGLKTGQRFA